jgi:hypothetical protein
VTDYQHFVLQTLRDEILYFNQQQLVIVVVVTLSILGLYVVSHHSQWRNCARLIPVMIISGLAAIGRADLLMHRAGAYVAGVECSLAQPVSGQLMWEAFKSSSNATSWLPAFDLAALTLWAYLLVWAELQVWRDSRGGDRWFVLGTAVAAVLAGASILVAAAI